MRKFWETLPWHTGHPSTAPLTSPHHPLAASWHTPGKGWLVGMDPSFAVGHERGEYAIGEFALVRVVAAEAGEEVLPPLQYPPSRSQILISSLRMKGRSRS